MVALLLLVAAGTLIEVLCEDFQTPSTHLGFGSDLCLDLLVAVGRDSFARPVISDKNA